MRPAAGRVKMGAMPDVSFQFARVRTSGKTLWHVQQGGRFIMGEMRATEARLAAARAG
jgi:hypothetical protein